MIMYKELKTFKPNINKTFSIMEKTYRDAVHKKGGNVTFRALPPSDVDFYNTFNLMSFNFEDDINRYAKELLNKLFESFEARKEVDDNMIPSISPVLGIGDYSAFVTGDIVFKPDTSWSTPSLENIGDWKKLPPLGTSKWYKKFLAISEEMLKLSMGSNVPFMRGFFSPLDLAGALRGDKIYFDFYDSPDELHELLDFCADATIQFAEDIYSLAKKYLNNTEYGMWFLNGNINMSEDIACMISGELYKEFAAPHTQKVIDHFGTGHMHCHSRAMYLVKEICNLKNVANLWLATDPNQNRPIDFIEKLNEDANGVCLAIDCNSFSEIEKNYKLLKRGNYSICLPVKNIKEACDITERFKKLNE